MTPELVAITARAGAAMKSQSGPAMLQPRIWGAFYRSAGAKVAAIVIHPTSNFMGHYMLQPLAQRGSPRWASTRAMQERLQLMAARTERRPIVIMASKCASMNEWMAMSQRPAAARTSRITIRTPRRSSKP